MARSRQCRGPQPNAASASDDVDARAGTGEHEFDTLCAALDIDHRLTPPKSPQTNGMVERFPSHAFSMRAVNGRIEEVLQSQHFRSGEELETTLHRYVWLYNQQLPQSALGGKTALASHERLAQHQARAVQETAILPSGM